MDTVIREKRMEKNLSQKDLADHLGVSASAVSKWEKGKSLPDVTLLGPLARLLEVSLEELLNFEKELSAEREMEYLEETRQKLLKESFEAVLTWVQGIILTYPSSYTLILWMTSLLESHSVMAAEGIAQETENLFESWYLRVLQRGNEGEKFSAAERLYHLYLRQGDLRRAEETLNHFSKENPQRKRKKALIERKKGNVEEAWKTYEELLFATFQMANETFQEMVLLAMEEKDLIRAKLFAEKQSQLAKAFDMGLYYEASPKLELAVHEKDPEEAKNVVEDLLKGIDSLEHFTKSPLYEHMAFARLSTEYKEELRKNLLEALEDKEIFGSMKNRME